MSTPHTTEGSVHDPTSPRFFTSTDGKTTAEVAAELELSNPRLEIPLETLCDLLVTGSNPVVHIRGGLPQEYCERAVGVAAQLPFAPYEKTTGSEDFHPIAKFGPTLFDFHGAESYKGYFVESAEAANAGTLAFTSARVRNPLLVALRALSSWPGRVEVATETRPVQGTSARRYFSGVIRDIRSGALPHVDDAATETPELVVGDIVAQATLLFYIQVPTEGGAVRVYDKVPTEDDYRNNVVGYGFSPDAVRGESFKGVTPDTGSVVMFRTTQIHSVDAVIGTGHRITWSTFIGLKADGSLVLWS